MSPFQIPPHAIRNQGMYLAKTFGQIDLEFRMNGVTSKSKATWRCAWAPDEAVQCVTRM